MLDADSLFAACERPLVLGIGGGGDVVGALATADLIRLYHGGRPVVGGVAWERRPIDPVPGPRSSGEVEGASELAPGVLLARADTRVRAREVLFAESHMAGFLGEETVLLDILAGPASLADGLAAAADRLGADLLVFVDVGGDALAHGHEPGLGSPLCDAVVLAAAGRLQRSGRAVLGGVFGVGCDGELTLDEVSARLAALGQAGGIAGARGITPPIAERLEGAIARVPTEASAAAVRAFRGEYGRVEIRGGRRSLELSPAAAGTVYFDVLVALEVTAPLARAVDGAGSLTEANEVLRAMGVRSELDWETDRAAGRE